MAKKSYVDRTEYLITGRTVSGFPQTEWNQRFGHQTQGCKVGARINLITMTICECFFATVKMLLKQVFIYIHLQFGSASRRLPASETVKASPEENCT